MLRAMTALSIAMVTSLLPPLRKVNPKQVIECYIQTYRHTDIQTYRLHTAQRKHHKHTQTVKPFSYTFKRALNYIYTEYTQELLRIF